MAKKSTEIYKARAQLYFCSLNLLFGDVLVAVISIVCLSSLCVMDYNYMYILCLCYFFFDSVASIPCYSASFGKTEVGIIIFCVLFSPNSEGWSTIKVSIFGKLLQVCISLGI